MSVQILLFAAAFLAPSAPTAPYPWLTDAAQRRVSDIPPPPGFNRSPLVDGSFGAWLRELPLKPGPRPVRLFDGSLKRNQSAHAAVVDIDVGDRDLQQCADLVIRLRAEYLFAAGRVDDIRFGFESGAVAAFRDWANGDRPQVRGRRVSWTRSAPAAGNHDSLRAYLTTVFQYASTRSLARELAAPADGHPEGGDVFLQAGSPGHAVLVVDRAENPETGEVSFLLVQSYMPAQEPHVLKSLDDISPWYRATAEPALRTPEWTFRSHDRRRFPERSH